MIAGVVIAFTALLPRWAGPVSWAVVMVSILLGPLFGAATFQLPPWVQDISPFTHIPKAAGSRHHCAPVVGLLAMRGTPRRGRPGGIPPARPCPADVMQVDPRT